MVCSSKLRGAATKAGQMPGHRPGYCAQARRNAATWLLPMMHNRMLRPGAGLGKGIKQQLFTLNPGWLLPFQRG